MTTAPSFDRALNVASFDALFRRVNDTYYDPARLRPAPAGIGWDRLQETLRPQVEAATTMDDVRAVMKRALDALEESHFAIIPGPLHDALPSAGGNTSAAWSAGSADPVGSVGLQVRIVEGVPIVGMVDRPSAAASAGVRAGWELVAIDDRPISDLISDQNAMRSEMRMQRVRAVEQIEAYLTPPVGRSVRLTFRSLNGESRTVRLRSREQPGMWASVGNLPAMNLRYSAQRLPGGIGYFSLSVFLNPPRVMPAFAKFIEENQASSGIVIDLRGNPGGLGAMATGMCGFFVSDNGRRLGTMIRRDGNLQFVVNPRYPQFEGPVAVLVDEMSMSTSEILAGGLQDLGRARVFGQPTPGAALPSTIVGLPNGDGLQYVLANYVSMSGRRLEGRGIHPDVIVTIDRAALEAGRDPVLEAACEWIRGNSSAATMPATRSP